MGKTLKRQKRRQQLQSTANTIIKSTVHASCRITNAFDRRKWDRVIVELKSLQKPPKHGTLQRWVRAADCSGCPLTTARLLNAIMTVAGWKPMGSADIAALNNGPILNYENFSPDITNSCNNGVHGGGDNTEDDYFTSRKIRIQDNIMTFPADIIKLCPNESAIPNIQRQDIPFIPGGFMLTNVFSPTECHQFIRATESLGFHSDIDYSFGGSASSASRSSVAGRPSEGCFWLVHPEFLHLVFSRVQHLLPQAMNGCTLAGINARWRFYRYDEGSVYRPHIDGAWPGSGLSGDGKYLYDAFGNQRSQITFLIYLNDDFEGGYTTFYRPSHDPAKIEARGVVPKAGCVLCFPHGGSDAAVHEGAVVTKGSKYVMRSDVLYTLPSHQTHYKTH